ncbi:MAG: hypothetical protein OYH77_00780 [Pseudomonadota bacterium]|nr:hypothetical protein [Pseudomonadota bacterium]
MIRVNLSGTANVVASNRWYIFDLIVLAVVMGGGYYGVEYYINAARESIRIINAEREDIMNSVRQLKSEEERYNQIEGEIAKLQAKIKAIEDITVSVFVRYQPLIVLEHLQVLQPDGVWYDSLIMKNNSVSIAGGAFDNLMIASLITAVDSTKLQGIDYNDIRTYIYFDSNKLLRTEMGSINNHPMFRFSLELTFKSKATGGEGNFADKVAANDIRGN